MSDVETKVRAGSPVGYVPRLITPKEAAEILSVDSKTVLNWIHEDRIPYVELPGGSERSQYRIPLSPLLISLSGTYDLAEAVAEAEQRWRESQLPSGEVKRLAIDGSD